MRGRIRSATLVALVAVVGAGIALTILQSRRAETAATIADPAPSARYGRPTEVTETRSTGGTLVVQTGTILELRAPAWEGVVTDVNVDPGETIGDRTAVVAVDSVERRAAITDQPFHRSLGLRDRGSDVEALNQLLVRWGYLDEQPNDPAWFSWRTGEAVRQLATDLGASTRTRVFEPGWLLWLPDDRAFTVATVDVGIGQAAPQLGDAVAHSSVEIVGYDLQLGMDGGAGESLDGSWTMSFEAEGLADVTLPLIDGRADLDRLASLLAVADAREAIELVPSASVELPVRARADDAETFLSVPVTSLRTSPDGTATCVFTRSDDGKPWEAIPVAASDAPGPGLLLTPSTELAGRDILFNPGAVLEDASCPSP